MPNLLGDEVEEKRWLRRPTTLQRISAADLSDFPRLTERELIILASGPYQLQLAASYLAETLDDHDNVQMSFVKEERTIVRLEIASRHINRKTYRLFIKYRPGLDNIEGIEGHWCECPNGSRTVGCCSHVAAAIYYLCHARYLGNIPRPAADLMQIFAVEDEVESDDDYGSE